MGGDHRGEPGRRPGGAGHRAAHRDVTEQHEAAEQLRAMAGRLGSLVAHLPVGVMLADEKGRITYVNRAAAELLRLDGEPDELVRAGPKAMWDQMRARHPDFEEHLLRAQEIIGERRSVLDERVVVHDGRTLSRSHVPIVDGTVYRGFLWIFQDLTEQVTMVAEREHLLEVEQRAEHPACASSTPSSRTSWRRCPTNCGPR